MATSQLEFQPTESESIAPILDKLPKVIESLPEFEARLDAAARRLYEVYADVSHFGGTYSLHVVFFQAGDANSGHYWVSIRQPNVVC